jgi:hypothetical protein
MTAPSFDDFVAAIEPYFELPADDGARRRLFDQVRAILGDRARELGLRDLLRGDTASVADGQAWLEELGDRDAPSDAELMRLVVALDASLASPPAARPFTPAWLVGAWQLDAVADDGVIFASPSRAQRWDLRADGTIAAPGDPLDGARWRLHRADRPELMTRAAGAASWRRWLILRHDDAGFDVIPPGSTHRTQRWRRVAP